MMSERESNAHPHPTFIIAEATYGLHAAPTEQRARVQALARLLKPGAIGQKYASQWGEIFADDEEEGEQHE